MDPAVSALAVAVAVVIVSWELVRHIHLVLQDIVDPHLEVQSCSLAG